MSTPDVLGDRGSARGGRATRLLGGALVVAAVVGFLTVADDLRHVGELAGVTSLLVSGLALLAASFRNRVSAVADLRWFAALVLAGALAGAAFDRVVLGVVVGGVAGCVAAMIPRDHSTPVGPAG